jgi:hypothetical protein
MPFLPALIALTVTIHTTITNLLESPATQALLSVLTQRCTVAAILISSFILWYIIQVRNLQRVHEALDQELDAWIKRSESESRYPPGMQVDQTRDARMRISRLLEAMDV